MIVSDRKPALAWTVALLTCTCLHANTFIDGLVNESRQGHIAPIQGAIKSHKVGLKLEPRERNPA